MLKKFVSLVVGVSLALATIGVAAANPEVMTQSVYDGSTKTLTVVTTVTNAEDGSTYTYMAYDKSVGEDVTKLDASTIKYVDQKVYDAASGTNLAFEFETTTNSASKLFQDIIKVGGKNSAGVAYQAAKSGVGENEVGPRVTVNDQEVTVKYGQYISTDIAATDYVSVDITGLTGTVKAVEYTTAGGATVAVEDFIVAPATIWLKKSDIVAAASIAITTEEQAVKCATLDMAYIAEDDIDGKAAPAIIVVGQVKGTPRTYGVIFSKNADFSKSRALNAEGKAENGMFAIKVRNFQLFEDFEGAKEMYAMVYYTYEDKEAPVGYGTVQGKPFVVDVTGETVSGDKLAK